MQELGGEKPTTRAENLTKSREIKCRVATRATRTLDKGKLRLRRMSDSGGGLASPSQARPVHPRPGRCQPRPGRSGSGPAGANPVAPNPGERTQVRAAWDQARPVPRPTGRSSHFHNVRARHLGSAPHHRHVDPEEAHRSAASGGGPAGGK
jgi:hypothetical protein